MWFWMQFKISNFWSHLSPAKKVVSTFPLRIALWEISVINNPLSSWPYNWPHACHLLWVSPSFLENVVTCIRDVIRGDDALKAFWIEKSVTPKMAVKGHASHHFPSKANPLYPSRTKKHIGGFYCCFEEHAKQLDCSNINHCTLNLHLFTCCDWMSRLTWHHVTTP